MAVQLSIGRIPSILLLALLGLAVVAGTASYLSRPEPEIGTASKIVATVPLATLTEEVQGQVTVARLVVDPNGQNDQAYSLADAMRDAIWRKNTAARLKILTASQSASDYDTTQRTSSIGLIATC